jgi:NADH:flavin oxidoreductase / NADH oxidase family
MFQPFRLGGLELPNRVIVSPMDMYSARDGVPGDFHLVHLGSKALGGAGLVMTEMVCVSPTGRITPGCTGIYTAGQEESWRRITAFVHGHTGAKMGIQLGHSGRKGSTRLMWDGMDTPLAEGNWEVCGPSEIPYAARSQTPRELTPAELDEIRGQFTAAALAAARAGFDLLELHDVNSLILAGRADLCALGRTHLYDPQWTLHAAAEQGYAGPAASWPDQFAAGSRRPQAGRNQDPRPRLDLIRAGAPGTAHARWRPGAVAAATETQALPAKRRSAAGRAPPRRGTVCVDARDPSAEDHTGARNRDTPSSLGFGVCAVAAGNGEALAIRTIRRSRDCRTAAHAGSRQGAAA